MIIWGNRRRLCFSAWILAALLLIGLNGTHLIALQNQPLVGHSPTIKALRLDLSRWENALATRAWLFDDGGLDPALVRYRQPPKESSTNVVAVPEDKLSVETPDMIALPVLSGVVQALAQQGKPTYLAVLDGRVYQTGDRVATFVVERIAPHGVILNRSGRQWQIQAPTPNFSEDQGN